VLVPIVHTLTPHIRDISAASAIAERTAVAIMADLEAAGYRNPSPGNQASAYQHLGRSRVQVNLVVVQVGVRTARAYWLGARS
jgi:hypothetical protein